MTILAYRLLFCMTLIFFTLIKKLMGNNDGNEEPSNPKVQRIINELGGQLLNYLPKINWQFESVISKQCEPILPRRLHLMLDKRYFPTPEVGTIRELQLYWSLVAIHTAAYVYKTVGAGYSEAMKVWLANAAYATITFSLIGEIPRSENKITVNPDTVESISVPDSISIDEADGNWFYGQWTNENLASEVDMQDVIRPEMIDTCLKVMLAAVVNFYHENRFTPSQTSIDNDNSSYAVQIIKGDLMDRYGIVDQSDKIMVMKITGQWISRIRVFNVITCLQTLKHPLRDIRTIGPGKLPLTREVRDESIPYQVVGRKHRLLKRLQSS
ncbi:unnamed protein product [Heterobilharzia americana]|nr:unnamed protein product [Heterobilharzia americana]